MRMEPSAQSTTDENPARRLHGSRLRRLSRAAWAGLRLATPELAFFAVLAAVTVALFGLIFPPRAAWPLAFFCLTPWAFAACVTQRAWVVHWGSFAAGWIAFLINLNWLLPVTGLGLVALAFYLAFYWTLAAWAVRTGLRAGISPVWTLPVVWVSCEFLRAWVMTGFPWLFLSHAFYQHLAFIQISDLVGAYGVTFIAAMSNGLLVDVLLRCWPGSIRRPGLPRIAIGAAATMGLMGANLWYGKLRIEEARFEDGPRIAVIQEDFLLSNTEMPAPFHFQLARYFMLAAEAMREKPDLIAFPETAWSATQNLGFVESASNSTEYSFGKQSHALTSALARGDFGPMNKQFTSWEIQIRERSQEFPRLREFANFPRLPMGSGHPAALVVGAIARAEYPEAVYPRSKKFNSVLLYNPDGNQRLERYDKMHLVPFGEIVPFRNMKCLGIDFHWLYRLLNGLSPFSDGGKHEYSLWPGEQPTIFALRVGDRDWRFGTPICYEDVMPYLVRRLVWDGARRRADFLINVSNDGWFLHSAELPQHLAAAVFRAVENRVGIARAVNTGISGFIDPNGRIYSLVQKNGQSYGSGIVGWQVDHVRIDPRDSFYGRTGDWFAIGCTVLTAALWVGAIVTRWVFAARARIRTWRRRPEEAMA